MFELRHVDEDDFGLDEIVAKNVAMLHIERMSRDHMWIGIETEDGKLYHVNFWIKKRTLWGRCEFQADLKAERASGNGEPVK